MSSLFSFFIGGTIGAGIATMVATFYHIGHIAEIRDEHANEIAGIIDGQDDLIDREVARAQAHLALKIDRVPQADRAQYLRDMELNAAILLVSESING